MTTVSDIETAWNTAIWGHATITALTPRIFNREIPDLSEEDVRDVSYQQEINFFEWLVKKSVRYPLVSRGVGEDQAFLVEIRYTREKDPHTDRTGTNYNSVRDAYETLLSLVKSELGNSWDSTVDFYTTQQEAIVINERVVGGVEVWSSVFRFQGFKRTNS